MSKLLIWLVTIFCPGIIFLMKEKYIQMFLALALQVSVLGWIPAIIWARHFWKKSSAPTEKPENISGKSA